MSTTRLPRRRLGAILEALGAIDEETLALALAEQAGLEFVDAREARVDRSLLHDFPIELARSLLTLPLRRETDGRILALIADPADPSLPDRLAVLLRGAISVQVASPSRLLAAIEAAYALDPRQSVRAQAMGGSVAPRLPADELEDLIDAPPRNLQDELDEALDDHGDDGGWGLDEGALVGDAPFVSDDVRADLALLFDESEEQPLDGGTLPSPERAPLESVSFDAAGATLPSEGVPAEPLPAPPGVARLKQSLRREDAPRPLEPLAIPSEAGAQLALVLGRLTEQSGAPAFLALAGSLVARALAWGAEVIEIIATESGVRVRYRLDGTWQGTLMLPRWAGRRLASAVDALSSMTTLPQGGRRAVMSGVVAETTLKIVTDIQSAGGRERREIRLLDPRGARKLVQLGMPEDVFRRVRQWTAGREGVVVLTGRRDGGRTTTLQAIAEEVGRTRSTVVIEQTRSFRDCSLPSACVDELAGGLGEALDRLLTAFEPRCVVVDGVEGGSDTSRLLGMARRGVLVVVGVDGADAFEAIDRLRRQGVPDVLLGPSVLGIVEQRLVRLLCVHCAGREPTDHALAAALSLVGESMPKSGPAEGGGCPACHHSGGRGRAPIFSRIELANGVPAGCSEEDLRLLIDRSRARPAAEEALPLFVKGRTSLREIGRAVGVRTAQAVGAAGGAVVSVAAPGWGADMTAGETIAGPGRPTKEEFEEISLDQLPRGGSAGAEAGDDRVKILVVESTDRVGPLLAGSLPPEEYRVLVADALDDARRLVDEENPAIVVMSWPQASGLHALIEGLRAHAGAAFLPLIAVAPPQNDPMDFLLAGADEVTESSDDPSLQLEIRQILLGLL